MDGLLRYMALCGCSHHLHSAVVGEPRCYDKHTQGIDEGHAGEDVTKWFSASVHGIRGRTLSCLLDYRLTYLNPLLREPMEEIS